MEEREGELNKALDALPILANSAAIKLNESPTGPYALAFQMHLNSRVLDLAYNRMLATDPSLAEAIHKLHQQPLPSSGIDSILALPDMPIAPSSNIIEQQPAVDHAPTPDIAPLAPPSPNGPTTS